MDGPIMVRADEGEVLQGVYASATKAVAQPFTPEPVSAYTGRVL
jgi:hypothetical protein